MYPSKAHSKKQGKVSEQVNAHLQISVGPHHLNVHTLSAFNLTPTDDNGIGRRAKATV